MIMKLLEQPMTTQICILGILCNALIVAYIFQRKNELN